MATEIIVDKIAKATERQSTGEKSQTFKLITNEEIAEITKKAQMIEGVSVR
jgi:hypothetical protein